MIGLNVVSIKVVVFVTIDFKRYPNTCLMQGRWFIWNFKHLFTSKIESQPLTYMSITFIKPKIKPLLHNGDIDLRTYLVHLKLFIHTHVFKL